MAAKPQAMDAVDAAWYHMDEATNLAMVTGVTLTQDPLDFEARQGCLRTPAAAARPLPPACRRDRAALSDAALGRGSVLQHRRPFPPRRPARAARQSKLCSICSATSPARRSTIGGRSGRCTWSIASTAAAPDPALPPLRRRRHGPDGHRPVALRRNARRPQSSARRPVRGRRGRLLDSLARPVKRLLDQSAQAVSSGANLVLHPSQAAELAQLAAQSAGVAVGVFKTPDPQSPLKGKLGVPKRVAWSEPIALDDVKAVGKATNAKVNDVLVAAMAGALRHYMQERGSAQDGMTIRAVVPCRPARSRSCHGSGQSLRSVFLDLPVGTTGPLEQLYATKAMDGIKRSPEAAFSWGFSTFWPGAARWRTSPSASLAARRRW